MACAKRCLTRVRRHNILGEEHNHTKVSETMFHTMLGVTLHMVSLANNRWYVAIGTGVRRAATLLPSRNPLRVEVILQAWPVVLSYAPLLPNACDFNRNPVHAHGGSYATIIRQRRRKKKAPRHIHVSLFSILMLGNEANG